MSDVGAHQSALQHGQRKDKATEQEAGTLGYGVIALAGLGPHQENRKSDQQRTEQMEFAHGGHRRGRGPAISGDLGERLAPEAEV